MLQPLLQIVALFAQGNAKHQNTVFEQKPLCLSTPARLPCLTPVSEKLPLISGKQYFNGYILTVYTV
jgi:hypothetical protein